MDSDSNIFILHIEDNVQDQNRLHDQLVDLGYTQITQCRTSQEAEILISQHSYDLAIIDIMLEGSQLDGVQLGLKITETMDIPILYTSSLSDSNTMSRFEQLPTYEYIVKPVPQRQLYVGINKLLSRFTLSEKSAPLSIEQQGFFFVKSAGKNLVRIDINDLYHLQASMGGTLISTKNKKVFVYISLNEMVDILSPFFIIRCHLSHAFALHAIKEYSDEEIILTNGHVIPISRTWKKQLRMHLNNLVVKPT